MTLRFNDRRRNDVSRYPAAAAKFGWVACAVDAVCVQWPDGQGVLPTRVGRSGELLPLALAAGPGGGRRACAGDQRVAASTDRVCRPGHLLAHRHGGKTYADVVSDGCALTWAESEVEGVVEPREGQAGDRPGMPVPVSALCGARDGP